MSGIVGSAGSKSGVIGTTELDYEEGTWTPALKDASGNSATLNSSYDLCRYVKIGKLVYLTGLVGSTSISGMTTTDQLRLTGLPFTVASGNEGYTATCFGYGIGLATGTAGYNAGGYVVKEDTYFLFTKWDNTGGTGSLTVEQWTADGRVMFNITYISA